MIIEKTGNIFDTDARLIGHGVNTYGAMASGIALQFKERYPEMHDNYVDLCQKVEERYLLGTAAVWADGPSIANIFSQNLPGPHANYIWAIEGIADALRYAIINGIETLALPQIGCGVGGLEWDVMKRLITGQFGDYPVDIELWTYQP